MIFKGFVFLQETEIGKAVTGLRKHSFDKISKLAKTLFRYEFDLSYCMFSFLNRKNVIRRSLIDH